MQSKICQVKKNEISIFQTIHKSEELKEEVDKREGKVISLFALKRGILVYIHA